MTTMCQKLLVFSTVAVMCVSAWSSAHAGQTHDEDDPHEHVSISPEEAVSRVLSSASWRPNFEAEAARTSADYAIETRRPLPVAELTHEQIFGDPQVAMAQVTLGATQSLDLVDWRASFATAHDREQDAIAARERVWTVHITHAVRRAYFAVLYHTRRHDVHDAWLERLSASSQAVKLRQERGDDSLYSVRRIEREMELVRARHAHEHLELESARAELLAWLELPTQATPDLSARLAPEAPLDARGQLDPEHPEIERLRQLEQAARAKAEGSGKLWWRGWTLGAGYRYAQMAGIGGHGFVLGLSAPLPLWSVDEERVEAHQARAEEIATRSRIEEARLGRAERLAMTRLIEALGALTAMSSAPENASITRLANLAYDAGEATLAELLDAHHSETELELERVELEWIARQAAIDLERARGGVQ